MYRTLHASVRAQQRGIPPLVVRWLDEFGEEQFDGRGGILRFFSRRSVRRMERSLGRAPVCKLSMYLDAYLIESSHDGQVITVGHRTERIRRR